MRFFIAVIALLVLTTEAAQAQWLSREIEDPFGKDHIVGAVTAREGKGLIIRCVAGSRLELMFSPNEKGDSDLDKFGNTVGVKILVRIDNDPADSLDAKMMTNDNDKVMTIASIDVGLAERMAAARTRIAAVMEMMGQRFGTVSFGVRGSGPHIRKVTKACAGTAPPS